METMLLEQDLSRIEVDLFYLDKMQRDLIYNINLLRRDDIVSVMSEYRNSLNALREVRQKILQFRFLRRDLQKLIDKKIQQCDYYNTQLEVEMQSINKIIPFRKRRQ